MLLLYTPFENATLFHDAADMHQSSSTIPMTVVNVHTGQALMNVAYQGKLRELEFVE